MNKENVTHTHKDTHEYYSAIKENEILPFATRWMDLGNIMFSEVHQTERQILYYHTYFLF